MPRLLLTMIASVMALVVGTSSAQTYPSKPIRIVTAEAGGGTDFASRLIAQSLTEALGQQVVVDNRGGSGIIAIETVARSVPDGYNLLLFGPPVWVMPFLQENVSYDPVRDFSAITLTSKAPNILVVHPSLPSRSVKELIALAKAHPGELNYASGITGAMTHLGPELFKAMAGIDIVRVTYKGGTSALNAMIGGEVQLMFATTTVAALQMQAGRLRGLAVTSAQPSALAPGLPTIAASGLPEYEAITIQGLFAPARTPSAIITQLNREVVRYLGRADVKTRFFNAGSEVVGNSPEEFSATIRSESVKWGKLIKGAGIRTD